ncbi:peptidoglycan-binding domain-containing protein [Plantibacter flavus]|uniref:peptidoglycan-binding domain-containing protein n=1 Tax=Plantibacter flavus TaxID=150123 RepID=UPI001F02B66D|nr:peptidoglycan-binding domain-containing protein [Plantibacter flavus]
MAVVAAAVGWAGATVVRPAEDPLEAVSYTYAAVAEGEIGSDLTLNTIAQWKPVPAGDNRAAGVVTTVNIAAGDEVPQGTTLYTVNLRPVVVAQGAIPAFRAIGLGTSGPDVAQLQEMLAALDLYHAEADGEAGRGTVTAIEAWQKSLGLEPSGQVELGDVVFVPALPARVALDTQVVSTGATLAGGEAVVKTLPASPSFSIPVTEAQAAAVTAGVRVEISAPDGSTWEGFATDQTKDEETQAVSVNLQGAEGAPICGTACGAVPVTGEARLMSRIVIIEPVAGLVVPSAALITTASGETAVVDRSGKRRSVTVVASARGMSAITGVDAGTKVRVPAQQAGAKE